MKTLIVLLAGICVLTKATAQDGYGSTSVYDRVATLPRGKHLYVIPPNGIWREQRWKDSVYRFQSFEQGKLEMTNGFIPSHRPMLNYNFMYESFDIKQPTGEIVKMRKSPAIKAVWVGDHKFINDPVFGYLEIILEGKISVAQRTHLDGLYELSNGSRYPMRSLMDTKIASDKTTQYYWEEVQYYLVDEASKAYRVGAPQLKALARRHKSEIKAFGKANHIDYRKKEDILKIVAYANGLP